MRLNAEVRPGVADCGSAASASADLLRSVNRALIQRVVEHLKNGTTDLAPDVMRNEVTRYTDPAHFELEQRILFHQLPLVVCLSSDLAEPGQFRVFDDAGVPIVVVRGRDRIVRAFLNICRHRGARVVSADSGKASRFTCRFHGWTYNSEGAAIAIPQSKLLCDPAGADAQLIACPAAERHGLVFVTPTPGAALDLDSHLGSFGSVLELLNLPGTQPIVAGELKVACNWKYAFDTYFENYHFSTLHKDSIGRLFPSNLCLYDEWGLHHRLMFPPKEASQWVEMPESEWPVDAINTPYFIFPNTIVYRGALKPGSSYMTTFRLFPTGVGETVTRVAMYAPKGSISAEFRAEIEATFAATCALVGTEDYSVTGESWRHLASLPAGSTQIYGRQEIAVQNFHRKLARVLGAAGT